MSISNKLKDRLQSYGKWAVITGASSGIGLELTNLLAEAGLNVVMIARNEDRLQSIANDSEKNGLYQHVSLARMYQNREE